jgi:DNA-binding response OmpR family regulator
VAHSAALQKEEKRNGTILLVEDDPRLLDVTNEILEYENYQVTTATNGEVAINTLCNNDFDLVITDLNLGQGSGISVLKKAKELNPGTRVIIMTGNVDVAFAIEALRLNADDYLLKPFNLYDLLDRVSYCLKKASSHGAGYSLHTEIV